MPTSPTDAISTAGARPDVITHFEEIPWGASTSDVRAHHGDPLAEEKVVNGVELAYHRSVNDQQVEAEFTIHHDHGLIVGSFVVPFSGPKECGTLFTAWRNAIAKRYPDLIAREEQEVEDEEASFDEAFARGEASWCVEWDDPSNLARIELLVWPSAEVFWVSYYGPHADAWEEERFQAEQKNGDEGGAS